MHQNQTQVNKPKRLKKGQKIKIGSKEYTIEKFDSSFNKDENSPERKGELVLSNKEKDSNEILSQKYFSKKGKNSAQIGVVKERLHKKDNKDDKSFGYERSFSYANVCQEEL